MHGSMPMKTKGAGGMKAEGTSKKGGKKTKATSNGPLEEALGPMVMPDMESKSRKPSLVISASFDSYRMEDNTYRKESIKRLKKEIQALEEQMKTVTDDDIVSKARRSMEKELVRKRARLMEDEAYLDEA